MEALFCRPFPSYNVTPSKGEQDEHLPITLPVYFFSDKEPAQQDLNLELHMLRFLRSPADHRMRARLRLEDGEGSRAGFPSSFPGSHCIFAYAFS